MSSVFSRQSCSFPGTCQVIAYCSVSLIIIQCSTCLIYVWYIIVSMEFCYAAVRYKVVMHTLIISLLSSENIEMQTWLEHQNLIWFFNHTVELQRSVNSSMIFLVCYLFLAVTDCLCPHHSAGWEKAHWDTSLFLIQCLFDSSPPHLSHSLRLSNSTLLALVQQWAPVLHAAQLACPGFSFSCLLPLS